MKIAITAKEPNMESEVDQRFGRCKYLLGVDTETLKYEAIDNENALSAGGAGISTARMIAGKGVSAVLTGNCGPNAYKVLNDAGIKIITGVTGKVSEAIEKYNSGGFSVTEEPSVGEHFGKGLKTN